MMTPKPKKKGFNLQMRTFTGQDGVQYLVFKTPRGAYNVFMEVEAKQSVRECGVTSEGTTRQMWDSIWK